ncbi:MAG: DUF721 domain-containing protein [Myxococcales bacterium]|nr:DUF721 domain-containing protein [Myxococcales bacterium]
MTTRFRRARLKAPVKLSGIIERQSRKLRFHSLRRLEVIRSCWRQVAGEMLARHVVPVRLVRKTLRLSVADHAWLNEMSYLAGPLLERLQQALPGQWVEELKFVVGEPAPEIRPHEPSATACLAPVTDAMIREAEQAAEQVSDEALRQAILRASLARLRRLDRRGRSGVDHSSDSEPGGKT